MNNMIKGCLSEFYGFKVFKNLNLKENEYKFDKDKVYVGINVYKYLIKTTEDSLRRSYGAYL